MTVSRGPGKGMMIVVPGFSLRENGAEPGIAASVVGWVVSVSVHVANGIHHEGAVPHVDRSDTRTPQEQGQAVLQTVDADPTRKSKRKHTPPMTQL
jgi:hypothetical protein